VERADARRRVLGFLGSAAAAAALLAGCSSGSAGAGATCGSTRTAAGVPVVIKVARGSVSCRTAVSVENAYTARVKDGQVRGNGGGAPVTVSGWTCQGYTTPQVLSTGNASRCRNGDTEILAVLDVPSSADTAA
jgi:hypothetical protein